MVGSDRLDSCGRERNNHAAVKTSDPIAPLRDDLELQPRRDGTVDVRDPFLLQIFTLDGNHVDVARHFDGQASAKELAKALRKNGMPDAKARAVLGVAKDFAELDLLDRPEVWKKSPVVDNSTPYTIIQSTQKRLKVLPEPEAHARWSCGACGACCHGLAVEVSPEEEARIDPTLYEDLLGGEGFVEEAFIDPDRPAVRILRQRHEAGSACVFLRDDGLCAVHARQGMEAKPDACQIFPNMVIHVPGKRARLAMRTNCRTMHESFETGQPVEEHREHVLRLLETSGAYKLPKKLDMFGVPVRFEQADAVRERFNEVFDELGVTAEAIDTLDRELLGGRVKKARKKYGKKLLAYLEAEIDADVPVEQGALSAYFVPVKRGKKALRAMQEGKRPRALTDVVQRFLRAQMRNVTYAGGAMTLPDAGFGYAALLLALEATLLAISPKAGEAEQLKAANDAFIAFTMPVIETTAHAWPILDALDKGYAKRLREEL